MSDSTRRNGYIALAAVVLLGSAAVWVLAPSGDGAATARDGAAASASGAGELVVYKTPACGCCEAWAEHMEEAGFDVRVEDRPQLARVKRELGVPGGLHACHTAVVDGKVVEGHVPASTVERYLAEGAPGEGLAVPGMPAGSPGMPSPRPEPYQVYVFDEGGRTSVFESR